MQCAPLPICRSMAAGFRAMRSRAWRYCGAPPPRARPLRRKICRICFYLMRPASRTTQPKASAGWQNLHASAMLNLGSMYFNFPNAVMRDPAEGYRWLMRAALVDNPAAQEMLSGVLAQGAMVGARTVIPPDPIAADMWLRLAARSPFHDNASQRLQIESNMTSAQLAEATNRAAAWRPSSLDEVLAMTIALPAVASAKPSWPPELHGRALGRFKEAGENPPPWLRIPDFAQSEEVMSAITAIAAQCDASGNKHCVETCRQQLDYVVPPIKPDGLSAAELARYLQEHPQVSPVRAMRKQARTPEESMHFWALCANGIEDGP